MKPIAVITKNYDAAMIWLTDHLAKQNIKIKEYIKSKRTVIVEPGLQTYVFISDYEQAAGFHFHSYLVSPDYYSLEDYVKTRVV